MNMRSLKIAGLIALGLALALAVGWLWGAAGRWPAERQRRVRGEDFMGDMPQSYAWFCAVPKQGTRAHGHLRHTLQISGVLRWQCSKGSIDQSCAYGYRFDNA